MPAEFKAPSRLEVVLVNLLGTGFIVLMYWYLYVMAGEKAKIDEANEFLNRPASTEQRPANKPN